jgi:hypothetical protein
MAEAAEPAAEQATSVPERRERTDRRRRQEGPLPTFLNGKDRRGRIDRRAPSFGKRAAFQP